VKINAIQFDYFTVIIIKIIHLYFITCILKIQFLIKYVMIGRINIVIRLLYMILFYHYESINEQEEKNTNISLLNVRVYY
jgi:hypothetical protein